MSPKKALVILSAGFLLTHCQRMEFSEVESSLPHQEGAEEDSPPDFLSDKLDLVFVVDTREGMDPFLRKIFTPRLINYFKNYDLRVTYTNTSVSKGFIDPPSREGGEGAERPDRDKEASELCKTGDWLYRLGALAGGIYLGAPLAFIVGVKGTGSCIAEAGRAASHSVKNLFQDKKSAVNGQFLPFERKGGEPANYLTLQQPDYEEIFTNTFKPDTAGFNEFEAPQIQQGPSDPLAAVLLSFMRRQGFREGSQAVFAVITPRDTAEAVPFSRIQEVFQNIYGEDSSLQIIPVTPPDMSCLQKLKSAGVDGPELAPKLQNSVSEKNQPLSLCAVALPAQLAVEIKQFVSPVRRDLTDLI